MFFINVFFQVCLDMGLSDNDENVFKQKITNLSGKQGMFIGRE